MDFMTIIMQAEFESQLEPLSLPSLPSQQHAAVEDREKDPGLVIVYENNQVIHDALGQHGAPIAQGATPTALAETFQEYILQTILATPVLVEDNCVVKSTVGEVSSLFPSVFHRFTHNQMY